MGVLIVVEHCQSTTFVLKLAKSACYFFIFHIRTTSDSAFVTTDVKRIFRISNVFGSNGRDTEILPMTGIKQYQFLAELEKNYMPAVHTN